ncbi:MAG: xanthine dehydrogenase family protein subunit M [Blastocatellia bacterium]
MRAFEYASPTTKEQAVGLLGNNWADADILAGGTDLLALMKDDVVSPKRLVNIKDIQELRGITVGKDRSLRIGALATIQELVDHTQVRQAFPVIAQTAGEIAGPQIRNMGTVGGNLCQRPRCWYYRAGYGLLAKDKTGEPLVPSGDNRYHAILGNGGPAYFVSPSTLGTLFIALGGTVRIFGPKGKREIPVEKFFVIPQTESQREHDLGPNEIVTEIVLPPLAGVKAASYEVRQKDAMDWPLALASVALSVDGNRIRSARVVMGYVAPVPWRSKEAEETLIGKAITEETAKAAGDAAVFGAKSLGRNGYKIQLARVAVKRALLAAVGGAK